MEEKEGVKDNLVTMEAQWIVTVLNDCVTNMSMLSLLTPEIMKEAVFRTLPPETIILVQDYFALEQTCLVADGRDLSPDTIAEFADVTRSVVRVLKSSLPLLETLKELSATRATPTIEFISLFSRLKSLLLSKLQLTAEEERAVKQELDSVRKHIEEGEARLAEQTRQLEDITKQHQQIVEARDDKIERLKQAIIDVNRDADAKRAASEAKQKADNEEALRNFLEQEKLLSAQLAKAQTTLRARSEENWHNEQAQHRQIGRREKDVSDLLQAYDAEMTQKHRRIQDLQAAHEKERNELRTLSHYLAEVAAEKRRFEEEIAQIRAVRDEELVVERRRQATSGLVLRMFQSNVLTAAATPSAKAAAKAKSGSAKKRG